MIESCPHSAEWETQPGILLPCTVTVTSKSEVQAADEDRGDHSDLRRNHQEMYLKKPEGRREMQTAKCEATGSNGPGIYSLCVCPVV